MTTKFRTTLLIAFSVLILSCNSSSKGTIGYLNPASFRERFVVEAEYAIERLNELGYETIIMHAEDDGALQLKQGYELLDKGVDAIIIACVNGNTIAPLVRDAKKKGVKIIAYNRLINNSDYDLFITGNNKTNAELFCEAALSRKPKGNYVVLAGDRFDRNGIELKIHIDSILKPHIESGDINLLYESYIEDWNRKRAEFDFQKVVDTYGTDIDAVIACSDPMGLAVNDVMRKYGKEGDVVTMGQDAVIEMVRAIYNDEAHMTIYHPHKTLGTKTAELTIDIINGKNTKELATTETFNGLKEIPTVQINSIALTKENLIEVLVNNGDYTLEEITN